MAFATVTNKMKREKLVRILAAVVAASIQVPPTFAMVPKKDAEELATLEPTFILINPSVAPVGKKEEVQVFATPAGVAASQAEAAANPPAASAPASTDANATQETFEILSGIPLPVNKRGPGSSRESKYPFAKLEVGQSFQVAGSTVKAFASTISIQNKKGKAEGKHFTVRAITAGQPVVPGSTVLAKADGVIVFRMPNKTVAAPATPAGTAATA